MRYTKDARLDVIPAISSFYMHEEIIHTRPRRVYNILKNRRIEDLKERLIKHHKVYCKFLARSLFDYLSFASFGESRWANEKCVKMHPDIEPGGSRQNAYDLAVEYNPKNFLKTLSNLFNKNDWEEGYGGTPWGTITDHAMNYFTMSPKQFVDYVVDLSHNGGVAFDKPIVLEMVNVPFYKMILDIKLHGSLMIPWINKTEKIISRHRRLELDPATYVFMCEACRWGLFSSSALPHIEAKSISFPPPTEWGRKEMYIDDFLSADGGSQKCDECNRKIDDNGAYSTDENVLCYDCFYENHCYCFECGEAINKHDCQKIKSEPYCECCYDVSRKARSNSLVANDGSTGNSQEVAIQNMAIKYKTEAGRG